MLRQDNKAKSKLENSGEQAMLCCFSHFAEESAEEAPDASSEVRLTRFVPT